MSEECLLHEAILTELKDDVKQIKKILLGNGEVGFIEQTRRNRDDIDELKKRPKNAMDNIRFAITVAMFAAAAAGWFLK